MKKYLNLHRFEHFGMLSKGERLAFPARFLTGIDEGIVICVNPTSATRLESFPTTFPDLQRRGKRFHRHFRLGNGAGDVAEVISGVEKSRKLVLTSFPKLKPKRERTDRLHQNENWG